MQEKKNLPPDCESAPSPPHPPHPPAVPAPLFTHLAKSLTASGPSTSVRFCLRTSQKREGLGTASRPLPPRTAGSGSGRGGIDDGTPSANLLRCGWRLA